MKLKDFIEKYDNTVIYDVILRGAFPTLTKSDLKFIYTNFCDDIWEVLWEIKEPYSNILVFLALNEKADDVQDKESFEESITCIAIEFICKQLVQSKEEPS